MITIQKKSIYPQHNPRFGMNNSLPFQKGASNCTHRRTHISSDVKHDSFQQTCVPERRTVLWCFPHFFLYSHSLRVVPPKTQRSRLSILNLTPFCGRRGETGLSQTHPCCITSRRFGVCECWRLILARNPEKQRTICPEKTGLQTTPSRVAPSSVMAYIGLSGVFFADLFSFLLFGFSIISYKPYYISMLETRTRLQIREPHCANLATNIIILHNKLISIRFRFFLNILRSAAILIGQTLHLGQYYVRLLFFILCSYFFPHFGCFFHTVHYLHFTLVLRFLQRNESSYPFRKPILPFGFMLSHYYFHPITPSYSVLLSVFSSFSFKSTYLNLCWNFH